MAPNGDYLVAGTTDSNGVLARIAPDGTLRWARTNFLEDNATNDSDDVWDVAVTPDGYIALVGQETTYDNILDFFPRIRRQNFIVLLDSDGNLVWRTDLGNTTVYGLTYTQQGTFMTCGITGDYLTLIEVDHNGNVVN